MTYETTSEVKDDKIPNGYLVTYHQIRGYDSPTKWYEVKRGDFLVGEYATKNAAIEASIKDNQNKISKKVKEKLLGWIEAEGADYFFSDYISPTELGKEFKDQKLVELHEKFLKARKDLFDYIGIEDYL